MSVAVETPQTQLGAVTNLQTTITGRVLMFISIFSSWQSFLKVYLKLHVQFRPNEVYCI